MQLKTKFRTRAVEDRNYFANAYRSTDGQPYYSEPGIQDTVPGYITLYEQISTESGPDRRTMHYCEHYKVTRFCADTSSGWSSWINPEIHSSGTWDSRPDEKPTHDIWTGNAYAGSVPSLATELNAPWADVPSGTKALASYVPLEQMYHLIDPSGLTDLINSSLTAMLPGIRPASSGLVNDIIELKDMKYIPRSLGSIVKALKAFKRSKLPLKKLLKGVSDPYLTWSFGIAPVIRDVYGVAKGLSDMR